MFVCNDKKRTFAQSNILSMKKIVVSLFTAIALTATAQQDPQFSQYMFNRVAPNPASAGLKDAICATFLGRSQWMGFDGAPKTILLTVDAPLSIFDKNQGIAVTFLRDQIGFEKTIGAKLAYAYHYPMSPTTNLSFGLDLGLINKSMDYTKYVPHDGGDPVVPTTNTGGNGFDVGFGAMYSTQKWYGGISASHLTGSRLSVAGSNYKIAQNLYIMGGYDYTLNSNITLQPSILLKTDVKKLQADISCNALFKDKFWGGLSFRALSTDAVVLLAGVKLKDMKIGLSYDINLNKMAKYSNGGLELMFSYCMKVAKKEKYISPIRNVRFL